MSRLDDLQRFYAILDVIAESNGGPITLSELPKPRNIPQRGVYFFFETTEIRTDSGNGGRIVRIGTHALTRGSSSTLHGRLSQHRGTNAGGGNHRGSIFRLLVGEALIASGEAPICPSWGIASTRREAARRLEADPEAIARSEAPVEAAVSEYVRGMPIIFINVPDEPGPDSRRGLIERNLIGLLSNLNRSSIDPSSSRWLGRRSSRVLVAESGLWNQRHVDEQYDPAFLDRLEALATPNR
jgi:hypothetical protein